ncbi:hypothetical protein DDZ18_11650 [Marinicauda salina]|uniref:Uncharacterized protein n=1 Tax=Marinicauda salina TaxID=2135793 RepID=A0A2U2BS84_9PROT|nr:hypothetical protein [Marinicauda salina]PWE16838.1 hypothetical protein DDZ18_11650 [Marinicauda salina]
MNHATTGLAAGLALVATGAATSAQTPDAVIQSLEQAVAEAGEHTIVLVGPGETVAYTIEVDGTLQQLEGDFDGVEITRQDNDEISGGTATGYVGHGGADGFRVDGSIESITLARPGAARITVDGAPYHHVVIRGTGETVGYTLKVDGHLQAVSGDLDGYDASIQGNDAINGGRATGYVGGGGVDGFQAFGAIANLEFARAGAAEVFVDGAPFHTLAIRGTGDTVGYSVSIDGRLEAVAGDFAGFEASIQDNDSVDGGAASGYVGGGGVDAYRVYGGRPDVELARAGAADVFIDGEQVQAASEGDGGDEATASSGGGYRLADAISTVTDRAGHGAVDDTRRLDFEDRALTGIRLSEMWDRPCAIALQGAPIEGDGLGEREDEELYEDLCDGRPLGLFGWGGGEWPLAPDDHVVAGLEVCVNNHRPNARVKGLGLSSWRLDEYLDPDVDEETRNALRATDRGEQPNCSHWTSAACPYPEVATGVVITIRERRNNEWINGMRLICRAVETQ